MAPRTSAVMALSGCGLALGAQIKSTFLAQVNPISGSKDVQENGGDKGYHKDYPSDSRPDVVGDRSWTHVTVPSPGGGPKYESVEWYVAECKKINTHCTFIHGHRRKSVEEDLRFLEDEYLREKAILDERVDKHIEEKADVERINLEIAECKVTIKENSECPADLADAQRDLKGLQGVRDKSPSDVDRECDLEKEIIKIQKCVDELRAAEALLISHTASLPKQERHVSKAERKIPKQEDVVSEAKARWLAAQKNGVEPAGHSVEDNCDAERDELMKSVNRNMKDLWRIYVNEKGELEGLKDTHKAEKVHVKDQKVDVEEVSMKVSEAEAAVKEKSHCRPELVKAESKLAQLVSVPDRSSSDIDDECTLEKEVIELKQCMKVLRAAERVLAGHEATHKAEKVTLGTEEDQALAARMALPPQEKIVADAYEAWLRAKALRDAANCYPKDE